MPGQVESSIFEDQFFAVFRDRVISTTPESTSEVALGRHLLRGIAATIRQLERERIYFVTGASSLLAYDERIGIWANIDFERLVTLTQSLDGLQTGTGINRMSHRKMRGVVSCLLRDPDIYRPDFFDEAVPGLVFRDGFAMVDDYGVTLESHSENHRARLGYNYEFDTPVGPVKWLEFLESLFATDQDKETKKNCIQEFLGACLIGAASNYQRCLLFVGAGANGKSVLSEFIATHIFHPSSSASASPRRWSQDYTLATLERKYINVVSEIPEQSVLDSSVFKAIISGDRVMARLPYHPPYEFSPIAGHVFSANDLPTTIDYSYGFWRRFMIVTFNEDFTINGQRRDKDMIFEELDRELPAILRWALNGACRLIKNGDYSIPQSHGQVINEWQTDADPVYDFFYSCCYRSEEDKTTLAILHSSFKEWAEKVGRKPMGNKTLAKRLRALRIPGGRTGGSTYFQCGIRDRASWKDFR